MRRGKKRRQTSLFDVHISTCGTAFAKIMKPCGTVKEDSSRGRYVVASRDISAGTVICKSAPISVVLHPTLWVSLVNKAIYFDLSHLSLTWNLGTVLLHVFH